MPAEPPPYEEWKKEDLEAELLTRGLSKTGNKDDLAERLYENDEAREAKKGSVDTIVSDGDIPVPEPEPVVPDLPLEGSEETNLGSENFYDIHHRSVDAQTTSPTVAELEDENGDDGFKRADI